MDKVVVRIMDANFNRAREGLRVLDDLVRFGRSNQKASAMLRQLRQDLVQLEKNMLPQVERLQARDAIGDVGQGHRGVRSSLLEVWQANLRRVAEALRSLEEFSKLTTPEAAIVCQRLRFMVYTLEQVYSPRPLWPSGLYAILRVDQLEYVSDLVAAGVVAIQLRDKNADTKSLWQASQTIKERVGQKALFIVNDRVDVALGVGADGVHLGQDDYPFAHIRDLVGPDFWLGVSAANASEWQRAAICQPDYVGVGPVFGTQSKADAGETIGFTGLNDMISLADCPVVAIGGITGQSMADVLATGVTGVAVIGALFTPAYQPQATRDLVSFFEK